MEKAMKQMMIVVLSLAVMLVAGGCSSVYDVTKDAVLRTQSAMTDPNSMIIYGDIIRYQIGDLVIYDMEINAANMIGGYTGATEVQLNVQPNYDANGRETGVISYLICTEGDDEWISNLNEYYEYEADLDVVKCRKDIVSGEKICKELEIQYMQY